jgi:L-ascorbate metabolism protein UlaG (beta-lactamase superfamily)
MRPGLRTVALIAFFVLEPLTASPQDSTSIEGASVKGLKVTFIGHATLLIELNGCAFLTDPVFSPRIPGLKRERPPGVGVSDLPPLTAVLISHAHYDHLDVPTLEQLPVDVPIVLPPRTRGLAGPMGGRRCIELGKWKQWESRETKITAVPADHYGGRMMVDSPFRPANGYVIESDGMAVYFAGDTGRGNPFDRIGERFDLDLALLPIGAYRPKWIMRWFHLNPPEALDALRALGADFMIPMHWGTFKLSLEPMDEPAQWVKKAAAEQGLEERVIVLEPGESWSPLGPFPLPR